MNDIQMAERIIKEKLNIISGDFYEFNGVTISRGEIFLC